LEILMDITNSGDRSGAEVIQVYIRDDKSSLERPEKELKAFEKVFLESKEKKTVTFEITVDDLSFYDPSEKKWKAEDGSFTIMIGSSSRDIHLETKIEFES
ncbi:MAG: fibronectin type III-like domain-contianing protein, partial [Candidatus Heimdallarchaeota archaeon]